jgi:hypothetical protein
MKRSGESSCSKPDYKKACKIHSIKVFRVKKQVGDAHIPSKVTGHHSKQHNPKKHKNLIPFQVVEQQLNGEGVKKVIDESVYYSHRLSQFIQISSLT